MNAVRIRIPSTGGVTVSGLAHEPVHATACYVFAHGAGAGMTHPFMASFAQALFDYGIATLRFQFPYMEQGSKRPDAPAVAQDTVQAAVEAASVHMPSLPLFAGGKSFGGRMSSQASAAGKLPQVHGLVFAGFPLHPAGKPGVERAAHLADVDVPMLFLQGTRDALAQMGLVQGVVSGLEGLASIHVVQDADHSFHVPARSGRTDADVIEDLAGTVAGWMAAVVTS